MRPRVAAVRGRADAKAYIVKFGPDPIMTPHQCNEMRKRVDASKPPSSIPRTYNVTQATMSRLTP